MPSSGDIEISDLTLGVGALPLLRGASALCPAGRVTLIVGPSGSGKTVLLRVLAGLIRPGTPGFVLEGSIRAGEVELLAARRRARPAPVGIVFQNFALFDELSAAENLEFARDHRTSSPVGSDRGRAFARGLLEEFDLPSDTPVGSLSGGQKQRLAIARTLAYDPPVILYDEPTSGLDPAAARQVVERIRSTCESHGKTTVVVTHDYVNLAPIADNVLLLDRGRLALRKIESDELRSLGEALAEERGATRASPEPSRAGVGRRLWRRTTDILEISGAALPGVCLLVLYLVPIWRSLRWAVRYFRHYLWLLASPSSCLYFAGSGLIAGFVSTHFTFKFLPHRQYTEPLLADELLNGLGFATYRILVPVLLTILVAARCGAAVASDVGGRVYAHQVDAMRSMGAAPERYLLTNILYAFLVATPFLIGLGFLAAKYMSLTVFLYNYPEYGAHYWDGHFHRDLRVPGQLLYLGSGWLIAKLLVCGAGVGAVAYFIGRRPKGSGVEVSRGITATIIAATLYVLVVHFVFAFVEF